MPGGIVTDRMDNRNIEDRDLKKRIELLERNLESTKNDLIDTKNDLGAFKKIVDDLTKLIDSRIKIYMDKLNKDNSIEKSQTKSVESKKIENNNVEKSEEKKENKLDISKFIEEFSQEFNFINKDEFNEEMENDEIMLKKLIELIKRMFGIKDNKISELKGVETGLINQLATEKDEVRRLKGVETNLTNQLAAEKDEVKRLKGVETGLTNQLNTKKEELESIGDLLEARKLYDKYLSMETRILSKLDNVLIQRDFESFISSGYTLSSLDNVWDIVKIEYKNISSEDKEILKEVFAFFLSQINKRFKEAKYGLVQVEVGEDFDAVNQVDLSQNSKGRVSECVFYGYGFLKEKENPNDEDIISRVIKNPLVLTM